jgi:hypothetical protein
MEDITQKFVVRKILEGIKRSRPNQKDMRLPITREFLKVNHIGQWDWPSIF